MVGSNSYIAEISRTHAKLDLSAAGIEPLHVGELEAFEQARADAVLKHYMPGSIAPRFLSAYDAGFIS